MKIKHKIIATASLPNTESKLLHPIIDHLHAALSDPGTDTNRQLTDHVLALQKLIENIETFQKKLNFLELPIQTACYHRPHPRIEYPIQLKPGINIATLQQKKQEKAPQIT